MEEKEFKLNKERTQSCFKFTLIEVVVIVTFGACLTVFFAVIYSLFFNIIFVSGVVINVIYVIKRLSTNIGIIPPCRCNNCNKFTTVRYDKFFSWNKLCIYCLKEAEGE